MPIPDYTEMPWNAWNHWLWCCVGQVFPHRLGTMAGQLLMTLFPPGITYQLWRCALFCWNMQIQSATLWTVSDVPPCTTQHVADTRRREGHVQYHWKLDFLGWGMSGMTYMRIRYFMISWYILSCYVFLIFWSLGAVFDKCDILWKWLSGSLCWTCSRWQKCCWKTSQLWMKLLGFRQVGFSCVAFSWKILKWLLLAVTRCQAHAKPAMRDQCCGW